MNAILVSLACGPVLVACDTARNVPQATDCGAPCRADRSRAADRVRARDSIAPPCSPATCPGCCAEGVCQPGNLQSACGKGGVTCMPCPYDSFCQSQGCFHIDPPDTCGQPFAPKSNSGKNCTSDTHVCTADESCVSGFKNAAGGKTSICLGRCCADFTKAPDDPINRCPNPSGAVDGGTATLSSCLWTVTGKNDMVCDILCSMPVGGKVYTFSCPPGFDCVAQDPAEPDWKSCVPQ